MEKTKVLKQQLTQWRWMKLLLKMNNKCQIKIKERIYMWSKAKLILLDLYAYGQVALDRKMSGSNVFQLLGPEATCAYWFTTGFHWLTFILTELQKSYLRKVNAISITIVFSKTEYLQWMMQKRKLERNTNSAEGIDWCKIWVWLPEVKT